MVDSAIETSTQPDLIEFVVYRDHDDGTKYPESFERIPPVKYIRGGRIVLSEMWNACWKVASGEIFMHAGDDIVFKTKGWDEMVRSAFSQIPDRIMFLHGEDGAHHETFGTHGFIHKNWANAVGYFVPPFYSSDYNDTHLNDVANAITRRMYIPFVTEHMHFLFGKGEKDQTHLDRLDRHAKDRPQDLYNSPEHMKERHRNVQVLKEFINNFKR